MSFLRRLFGGGGVSADRDQHGMYFYVRPRRCEEVLRVRVDLRNDLSESEDGGYFVRKIITAVRCPFQAEMTAYFDANRGFVSVEVQDGEAVDEAAYDAYMAQKDA